MPLMVCVEKLTGAPFRAMALSVPEVELVGNIACRFLAPTPARMLKFRVLLLHDRDPKDDELRPSSQVNICRADTTGTPRAWAEAMIASAPSDCTESLCIFAVNAP
jgi:hypothetical protein